MHFAFSPPVVRLDSLKIIAHDLRLWVLSSSAFKEIIGPKGKAGGGGGGGGGGGNKATSKKRKKNLNTIYRV